MNEERQRLHKDLIKLGDMMGDGIHHEEPSIAKEYRNVAKALYPELHPSKKRKPSQKLLKTFKRCNCGAEGWTYSRYKNGNVGVSCKNCGKNTGECESNIIARDNWNGIIDKS